MNEMRKLYGWMMWLVGALTMASCGDDSDYV
jgi:hypothetical protein